jgi:hypothetical protein
VSVDVGAPVMVAALVSGIAAVVVINARERAHATCDGGETRSPEARRWITPRTSTW